jgi:hypothetical protein
VAGRADRQGIGLFGQAAVVGTQVAATDREMLHADEDLSILELRHLRIE